MDGGNENREPNLIVQSGTSRLKFVPQTPVVTLINIRDKNINSTSPQNEHNYLRRFRKIYESKGWITVQCTPTDNRIFDDQAAEVATSYLRSLEKRGLHMNPLIVHVISHEGLPVYNALCKAVQNEREMNSDYYPLTGCILDSCPKQPTGLLENLHNALPRVYDFLMFIIWLVTAIFPELFGGVEKGSDFDDFCFDTGCWPQLYLYSTNDHIVSHTDVEKAARIRKEAGVPVDMRCWEDTEHARHLFAHEQEYSEVCQQFVEFCLDFASHGQQQ